MFITMDFKDILLSKFQKNINVYIVLNALEKLLTAKGFQEISWKIYSL